MERTMSVEDKIRRAEEIYNRRRENSIKYNTAKVNVNNKKDYKLFKKMIWQIIICLSIYIIFYFTVTNNYVFSEDLRNKINEVLSYDLNFTQIYNDISNTYNGLVNNNDEDKENSIVENETIENQTDNNIQEQNVSETNEVKEETSNVEENIGGAVESNNEENKENEEKEEQINLTQEEQDILDIKSKISFIVPVEGYVSSKFGLRNPTTSTVPKNHTGLDIAAVSGTVIKSATVGTVSLASSEGDYGNHLKITNGDVTMVYAHCKTLYVKQGETVKQGQEIAEVGSTGNSTGPHLHFEIRKQDRFIDPQKIIDI